MIDVAFIGVGCGVVDEPVGLLDSRGQPGQVDGRPAREGITIRARAGTQAFLLQAGQDEGIDRVDGPLK